MEKKTILTAGLVLLAVAGALLAVRPNPQAPSGLPPGFAVQDREYVVSSYLQMEDSQPEGFVLGGSCSMDGRSWDYYINEEIPQWVYVHQEIYNSLSQKIDMKYVRYVDSRIRGVDYISYGGSLYVSMWTAHNHLSQEEQDRVREIYGLRLEGMPPAEFAYVGKAEFTGYDTIPEKGLGCNTGRPEVYIHSTDEAILLASVRWNTAPHGDDDGRHTGFNVYVKCEKPLN